MRKVLSVALLCAVLSGCTSMCKTLYPKQCGKTTPEIVFVEGDCAADDPLPEPTPPPETHKEVPPAEWRPWLEAFGTDYLATRAWGFRLLHIIRSYNLSSIDDTNPIVAP